MGEGLLKSSQLLQGGAKVPVLQAGSRGRLREVCTCCIARLPRESCLSNTEANDAASACDLAQTLRCEGQAQVPPRESLSVSLSGGKLSSPAHTHPELSLGNSHLETK